MLELNRKRKIQTLATYLIEIRRCPILDYDQIEKIVVMWNALDDGDKNRVLYSKRFKGKLSTGRFQVAKGEKAAPGVEMSRRAFLGSGSVPAQNPSCNISTIITTLANIITQADKKYTNPLRFKYSFPVHVCMNHCMNHLK